MRILNREDINKVKPKFQPIVLEAWKNGEDVPWGVTLLSDAPLTEKQIEYGKKLARRLSFNDELKKQLML